MRLLSFFSFYGRTRRTVFGFFCLATIPVSLVFVFAAAVATLHTFGDKIARDDPEMTEMMQAVAGMPHQPFVWASVIVGILWGLMCVAWVPLCVRRLHDMGGTGWIVVPLLLVAIIWFVGGFLVISFVLAVWPGSKGPNRYGRDPRTPDDIAAVFADPARRTSLPT